MKYSAILFDMDGLIFDTEMITYQAYVSFCAKRNLESDFSIYAQLIGRNYHDASMIVEQIYHGAFDFAAFYNYAQTFRHNYILKNGIPIKRGFYQLLSYTRRHNIKIAIVSSSDTRVVKENLNHASLQNAFDLIVGGELVSNSKPNPEIYLFAANKLNIPRHQCLVLEDSANGIIAGKDAGMDVVCIPDLIMHDKSILDLCIRTYSSLDKVIEVL